MMRPSKNMLNLGCGDRFHRGWTNIDFAAKPPNVIGHDLRTCLPFNDESFDVVYHSHVLEHFSAIEGERLLCECLRVLTPGGLLRVAVPDLENIARTYLHQLEAVLSGDKSSEANYDWMLIELFDQVKRNENGGEMAEYLAQKQISNVQFVSERIGVNYFELIRNNYASADIPSKESLVKRVRGALGKILSRNRHFRYYQMGRFRNRGDIHYLMFDQYSLARLMLKCGFVDVQRKTAFESSVESWPAYELDVKAGVVHAPLSLFMEARKP